MLAQPGEREGQLISHVADDRGPGDDRRSRVPARSTRTLPSPTMEKLRLRPSPVTESRSPRIGSAAMCVTSSCVVPRVIVNVPPSLAGTAVAVIGVPVGDVLDDLGAVVDDIERHRAEVGAVGSGVTVAVMMLPDGRVVDMRLLLRRDARGKVFQRHELVAGVVGLRDEVRVHAAWCTGGSVGRNWSWCSTPRRRNRGSARRRSACRRHARSAR